MLEDFIALIYPHLCFSCGKTLYRSEKSICTYCRYHLPRTNFHKERNNPISRIFWGRVNVEAATSYYFYNKGSKVQRLIHQLKYKGVKEIGIVIGKMFGSELKESKDYEGVEYIIPVPLHPKKLRKRGYNQSELIANGISEIMEKETKTDVLYRATANSTQTKKSHFERWRNVESVFKVKNTEKLEGKNLLLVDDVVTTGSTLEASANALLTIPSSKVSIATLAYTQ
ncbi:MAG: amidophosphoribosyltransferase [Flavobacteriales bacterium]|nr:MAG: amidophosphoribosyltransferase [Flavobacteriales bacterium]